MSTLCIIFWIFFLFLSQFSDASTLEVFDTSSPNNVINYSEVSSPFFDLGNSDFPVTGKAIFTIGCNGVNSISDEAAYEVQRETNTTSKLIVFVEQAKENSDDSLCMALSLIFQCQKRDWCGAVVSHSRFFNPSGFSMWSVFDESRPRSAYKVPLVEMTKDDFLNWKRLIEKAVNDNQSYRVTLTKDSNPWEKMFTSIPFLFYFQILTPIWSIGCLVLIFVVLYRQAITQSGNQTKRLRSSSTEPEAKPRFTFKPKKGLNLKQICLIFHIITHFSRLILCSVDPFSSKQIYPFVVGSVLVSLSIVFEIATNILLAFVIRELVQANTAVEMRKKVKLAYFFIALFFAIILPISVIQPLHITTVQLFFVEAFFYVGVNIVVGLWYFYQSFKFLRRHSNLEKVTKKGNPIRVRLTQVSMLASTSIVALGLLTTLISVDSVYGTPWGYFATFSLILAVAQILSLLEIFLFGGFVFDLKGAAVRMRRSVHSIQGALQNRDSTVDI